MATNLKIQRKSVKDNLIGAKLAIADNALLGSYDSKCNYFISPKIQEELVHIKKYKKTTFGNSLFCVAHHVSYGELVFEITYDKYVEENFSVATLYLLENEVKINGYLQNTIKTKICDYSDLIVDFIEKSYEFYNVEIDYDEAKDKKVSADVFIDMYIASKKQYERAIDAICDKKIADLHEKYFNKRMAILQKMDSPFATQVLEIFNKEHELIDNIFLRDNKDFESLNMLLDKAIEQVSGLSKDVEEGEKDFETLISKDKEDYEKQIDKIYTTAQKKAYDMLSKSDKAKVSDILEDEKKHEAYVLDGKDDDTFIVKKVSVKDDADFNEFDKNVKQDEEEAVITDASDYEQTKFEQMESRGERRKKLDALARDAEEKEEEKEDEKDKKVIIPVDGKAEKKSKAQSAIQDILSKKSKGKDDVPTTDEDEIARLREEKSVADGKAVILSKKGGKRVAPAKGDDGVVEEKVTPETPAKPAPKTAETKTPTDAATPPAPESKDAEYLKKLQDLRKRSSIPTGTKTLDEDRVVVGEMDGKKTITGRKVSEKDVVLDKSKTAGMTEAQKENLKKTVAKEETAKNQSEAYRELLARQKKEAEQLAAQQRKMDEMAKAMEAEKKEREKVAKENSRLTQENARLRSDNSTFRASTSSAPASSGSSYSREESESDDKTYIPSSSGYVGSSGSRGGYSSGSRTSNAGSTPRPNAARSPQYRSPSAPDNSGQRMFNVFQQGNCNTHVPYTENRMDPNALKSKENTPEMGR